MDSSPSFFAVLYVCSVLIHILRQASARCLVRRSIIFRGILWTTCLTCQKTIMKLIFITGIKTLMEIFSLLFYYRFCLWVWFLLARVFIEFAKIRNDRLEFIKQLNGIITWDKIKSCVENFHTAFLLSLRVQHQFYSPLASYIASQLYSATAEWYCFRQFNGE